MDTHIDRKQVLRHRREPALAAVFAALLLAGCNQTPTTAQSGNATSIPTSAQANAGDGATVLNPPGGHPLVANPEEEEYGEFLAKPAELAAASVNEIAKSTRLNATATAIGREVYAKNCAACHGEDMKGSQTAHAPDLTDDDWRFSGDDLESGGVNKFPSDVEWTVRYGVRSGHPYARGVEADMLAFDPQYRNEHDLGDFGKIKTVDAAQIDDLAEYVLQISGQQADAVKAARGKVLFLDNKTGNCFDCHTEEATGNPALGSTNLTRKETFLFGADKASIVESITKGRRAVMPAFEKTLKPEELKAVAVYVFSQAKH